VRIPLHEQIIRLRQRVFAAGALPAGKKIGLLALRFLIRHPAWLAGAGKALRALTPLLPAAIVRRTAWSRGGRALPEMPKLSFKELLRRRTEKKT
jgi:L-lactate dehydrogenase complex protein LldF